VRIGVCDKTDDAWHTVRQYTLAQVQTLMSAGDVRDFSIFLVTKSLDWRLPDEMVSRVHPIAPPIFPFPGVATRVRKKILSGTRFWRDSRVRQWRNWAGLHDFDVLLSFEPPEWWQPGEPATCSWIPDFQHVLLPQYFEQWEIEARDAHFRRIADMADLVVFSSKAVRDDFARFAPWAAAKGRIYHFPSRLCFRDAAELPDDETVLDRYGISRDFFLVVNQFWRHKNHMQVLDAMGILQSAGSCPQLVMIGQPRDTRDVAGQYMSDLLGKVATLGLEGRAKILGFVPATVRDALQRACKALVQPSECEGWNTSVEDAKALGRPVIASDLPVHREQVPDAFSFFRVGDPDGLAAVLERADRELPPGPDNEGAAACLEAARRQAKETGKILLSICEEAMRLRDTRLGRE